MRIRSVTAFALVALALMVSACAPGAMVVDEGDDGDTIELEVGQELEVRLDGNATTGFAWVHGGNVPDGLEQLSGDYETTDDEDVVGAGGVFVFTFEATEAGEGDLAFEYARSWEDTVAPERAWSASVVVSE
jgi:predicted secreted protein